MKKLRIISVFVFLIAVFLFGYNRFQKRQEQDPTPPVINMKEKSIEISVNDGEEAILEGITVTDKKDGDITENLIIESLSNFIEKGRRTATIVAFDSDHNAVKTEREIIYKDYISPHFALDAPLYFPVGTAEIMSGIHATDVLDGDVTERIKISGESELDLDKAGDYMVEFYVTNSAADVRKLKTTVTIYDPARVTKTGTIELSRYLVYAVKGKAPLNLWDYVEAVTIGNVTYERAEDGVLYEQDVPEDQIQGTITEADMSITHEIDYDKRGAYDVTYKITLGQNMEAETRLVVAVK